LKIPPVFDLVPLQDMLEPIAANEILFGNLKHLHIIKGIQLLALPVDRQDEGAEFFKRSDLPVDMQHLGFEKSGTIRGNNWHLKVSLVKYQ